MEKPAIIQVLEDAQLAHKSGDFVNALKFYEQFFDHALDDDPYALYGVRLSYCLSGWGELAKEFVGAKNRLQEKQQEVLATYQEQKRPEVFHDYFAISQIMGEKHAPVEEFLRVLESSQKSAARIVKFVWQDLLAGGHWQVCNLFLEDPVQKLDESFAVFDEANRLHEIETAFANDAFEQHILNQLINSVSELIEVLRHNSRTEDIEMIQRKFFEIAHARDHSALNKLIQARGTFLFGGH